MAETFTTRFGLIQWGAGTDGPSRTEFDTAFAQVESLAAMDKQGAGLGTRPAPAASNVGMYYQDTTSGLLYRSTGSVWNVVGATVTDEVASSSATSTVPLTLSAAGGQTARLLEAKVAGAPVAWIDATGKVNSVTDIIGARLSAFNDTPGSIAIIAKGAASQTADMLMLQDNSNSTLFKVQAAGSVQSKFFGSGAGTGYIGVGSASNVANLTRLNFGTPAFQIESGAGGTGGVFSDGIYLHHASVTTAATRRLGLLMRVGDEVVGDASKTGAVYIESTAANFTSSDLVFERGDTVVMRFPGNGGDVSITNNNLAADKSLRSLVNSGQQQVTLGSAKVAGMGLQGTGTNAYLRVPNSGSFYLYAGGTHSDTVGSAGTGGGTLMWVNNAGGGAQLVVHALAIDGNITPPSSGPNFLMGTLAGFNIQGWNSGFSAYNNGSASSLLLNNNSGGDVWLGNSGSTVHIQGHIDLGSDYDPVYANVPSSSVPNNGSGVTSLSTTLPTSGVWIAIADTIGPGLSGGGAYAVMDLWHAGNLVAHDSVGTIPPNARMNCVAVFGGNAGDGVSIVLASVSQFGGNWNVSLSMVRLQ